MSPAADLTPRVREVLKLLADGMSNKEIARVLHITDGTVKDHVSLALRRLCLKNRVQLAVWALRQELAA